MGTLRKGQRLTGHERRKFGVNLKKKYEHGASIRALAEATGRSYGFVHRILAEAGTTLRQRGGDTRSTNRTQPPPGSAADDPSATADIESRT